MAFHENGQWLDVIAHSPAQATRDWTRATRGFHQSGRRRTALEMAFVRDARPCPRSQLSHKM
jgi:hypothetical protein